MITFQGLCNTYRTEAFDREQDKLSELVPPQNIHTSYGLRNINPQVSEVWKVSRAGSVNVKNNFNRGENLQPRRYNATMEVTPCQAI